MRVVALLRLESVLAQDIVHAQGGPALAAGINETVVGIPVIVNGKPDGTTMVGKVFMPNGDGPFFSATHSRAWHQAFVAAGGNAEFKLLVAFWQDGHQLFVNGERIWQPMVAEFLKSVGF